MYAPRIFMMSRPQFQPDKVAKDIDIKYYIERYGYACALRRAWMEVVGKMYEELENYLSASGTVEDILYELKPTSRRMKVDTLEYGYKVECHKSGAGAEIIEGTESICVTFYDIAECRYTHENWDLSYSGSDNAAAFIATSLRAYWIIKDRFRNC